MNNNNENSDESDLFIINLPSINEPNLIEDYKTRKNEREDISFFLEDLRQNKDDYLNFDININDLKAILMKNVIMRVERSLIRQAIEEKKLAAQNQEKNKK